jgi:hypothetical protein
LDGDNGNGKGCEFELGSSKLSGSRLVIARFLIDCQRGGILQVRT